MAFYTITLKKLLQIPSFDIGLRDYPIFDESYRETLNTKIINHFLFCEIGAETPELFKFYLNRTMNEIMPLYNKLYETEKINIDPFNAINIEEIEIGNSSATLSNTSVNNSDTKATNEGSVWEDSSTQNTGTSKNKNLYSKTPSGKLVEVENGNYLSEATFDTNEVISNTLSNNSNQNRQNTSTNTNGNYKTDEDRQSENKVIRSKKGNENSDIISILVSLRDSFLNIDKMILDDKELKDCFMLIWG